MDFQQIRKYVKGVLTNSFLNKTTLDKLSTSDEGNLLFNGKELKNIGNVEASITELWSGQQSSNSEITLSDDYANYDVIVSMIEPLENYPNEQKFDFMLKGCKSLVGGMTEDTSYIASYRMYNWNGTSVYFDKLNNPSGWNFTLKKIWGIKFVSQLHEYSTEEKVVGKWIDGKPIYERVFTDVNVSLATADWHYVNVTIDNFKFVIDSFGFDGTYQCFKPFGASNNNNQLWWRHNNVNNTINIIVVQYTKTTD